MTEEFEGGVSCAENFWCKNFFGSTNDVAGFDWPNHGTTVIKPTKRSTDDSAGFSSSEDNNSNQDFFGKSEDNYSSHVLNNNFGGDYLNNNNVADKQVNGDYYPLQQHQLNSIERLSAGLVPLGSASYDYTSSLLQTLFETDEPDNNSNPPISHNYSNNYEHINISNEFLPNINNSNTHLPFTNNEPTATWTNDFLPAVPQSEFILKNKNEGAKKEPAMKRARIQAPSPLPTFKVRKEKLGDRVTALQQLVSPFGKTDTASVLHEAIEYIKYLHDQVSVFSSPYLKNKSPPLHLHGGDKVKQDLKSRGLCLVPISSTFPITAEITTDFWTPIFGESFN